MDKIWYIKINDQIEGPFSILDLKKDKRMTPDTLASKGDLDDFVRARFIFELREVFADDLPADKEETYVKTNPYVFQDDQLVLEINKEPSYFFWIFILLMASAFMLLRFYSKF